MCVSTALAGASLTLGGAKGIYDIIEGERRKKSGKAYEKEVLSNRQDLKNVYSGVGVPTQAYEMQRQEIQRGQATAASNLAKAGSRGAVGGAASLASSSARSFANLGAMFEQAQFNLAQMKAQDEARIRAMREEREVSELGYARSEVAYGRQQRQAGFDTMIDTAASGAEYYGEYGNPDFSFLKGKSNSNSDLPKGTIVNDDGYGNIA